MRIFPLFQSICSRIVSKVTFERLSANHSAIQVMLLALATVSGITMKLYLSKIAVLSQHDGEARRAKNTMYCQHSIFLMKNFIPMVAKAIESDCGVDVHSSFPLSSTKKVWGHTMQMLGKRYDSGTLERYEQIKQEYKGIIK